MVRAGLLDPFTVARLMSGIPMRAGVLGSQPSPDGVADVSDEEVPVVVPCPVQLRLSNALICVEVLRRTPKSAGLVLHVRSFQAAAPRYSADLDLASLHIIGSDGNRYRVGPRAVGPLVSVTPVPSPSVTFLDLVGADGRGARVPVLEAVPHVMTSSTSLSAHDAAKAWVLQSAAELVAWRHVWEPPAFAGGVFGEIVPALLDTVHLLGELGALGSASALEDELRRLDRSLRAGHASSSLSAPLRSMLDAIGDLDGRPGGLIVGQDMSPVGDMTVTVDALTSWPDHFTIWSFCTPVAYSSDDDLLSISLVDWSAEDDAGGRYVGVPLSLRGRIDEDDVSVVFRPRLRPRATRLTVTCSRGTDVAKMVIPLAPWSSPIPIEP
jgi:hypothetical protein